MQIAKNALALLSKYAVSPIPDHFELFYLYAAGSNPAICRRIDEIVAAGGEFNQQTLHILRENCLGGEKNAKALEQVGTVMGMTLERVSGTLATAGRHAGDFGRTLSNASGELKPDAAPEDVRTMIADLIDATQTMERRTKSLEVELQQSSDQVVELRRQLETVRQESRLDALTGIANRKAFDGELVNALTDWKATGTPVSLLMCDIDHFKKFNDTWGHQTGDQVLRLVASCISENVKGRDTAARFGGEEFAVILRKTRMADAFNLANQIRIAIESRKLIKKSTGEVLGAITVSIGVAEAVTGDTGEELIHRADLCLYRAKQNGRNCVIGQPGQGW